MTASEEQKLIDLAILWQGRACHYDVDCGDHDCMTFRECAAELIGLLNTQRINRVEHPEDLEYVSSRSDTPCGHHFSPPGWWCGRNVGHTGSCAAWPDPNDARL